MRRRGKSRLRKRGHSFFFRKRRSRPDGREEKRRGAEIIDEKEREEQTSEERPLLHFLPLPLPISILFPLASLFLFLFFLTCFNFRREEKRDVRCRRKLRPSFRRNFRQYIQRVLLFINHSFIIFHSYILRKRSWYLESCTLICNFPSCSF